MARARSLLLLFGFIFAVFGLTSAGRKIGEPHTATAARSLRSKRLVPVNQNCNPTTGTCRKGDFVDDDIADCYYDRWPFGTCTASGDTGGVISWVVEPDAHDRCSPESDMPIRCGDPGTNTRCVCSDYKVEFNQCKCQYWTDYTPGENDPAFCTAYYLGGSSGVHHYACCNNCKDPTPNTCDRHTYEGGSSGKYCDSCGKPTGGGQVKYLFNCDSCEVQGACSDHCSGFIGNLPGLCWRWVDCFRGCCAEATEQLKAHGIVDKRGSFIEMLIATKQMDFCGDGMCTGLETPSTCPTDCCYKINSTCTVAPGHCVPACCQMETCCSAANSTTATNAVGVQDSRRKWKPTSIRKT